MSNKNCSSEEISSSLFLFRLFHCFPYVVPSLCFLLYLVCFFSNESFAPFSFTFLFLCFFRCMQLSVKEWKSLFSVSSQKKSPFLCPFPCSRIFQKKKYFLHVLVTLCFESLLSFFLCSASHKKNLTYYLTLLFFNQFSCVISCFVSPL